MRSPVVGREPAAPIQADGTVPAGDAVAGWTLLANQTYYAALGGIDASIISYHLIADSALVLTSVTLQDTCFSTVDDLSAALGEWMSEDPEGAEIEVAGNCASVGAVVSKTAGAAGAAIAHFSGVGSARTRLAIAVGGAGGVLKLATHGKE